MWHCDNTRCLWPGWDRKWVTPGLNKSPGDGISSQFVPRARVHDSLYLSSAQALNNQHFRITQKRCVLAFVNWLWIITQEVLGPGKVGTVTFLEDSKCLCIRWHNRLKGEQYLVNKIHFVDIFAFTVLSLTLLYKNGRNIDPWCFNSYLSSLEMHKYFTIQFIKWQCLDGEVLITW